MTDKSFAIHLQHRRRRVDLQQEAVAEVLAGILRFNLDSWGGRHNPIVPLVDKGISDGWFALLDVADPDIFYIYGEANLPTLEALHSRYSPTFVTQHVLRGPIDSYSYGCISGSKLTSGNTWILSSACDRDSTRRRE